MHIRDWNCGKSAWHKAKKKIDYFMDILKTMNIPKSGLWCWIEIHTARITLSELVRLGMKTLNKIQVQL